MTNCINNIGSLDKDRMGRKKVRHFASWNTNTVTRNTVTGTLVVRKSSRYGT